MASLNYKPMFISLVVIFLVGGILPNIINGFAPDSEPQHTTDFIVQLSDYMNVGVCLPTTKTAIGGHSPVYDDGLETPVEYTPAFSNNNGNCYNPNELILSQNARDHLTNSINAFGYLPEVVSTPLLILILFGIGITTITLAISILTLIPFIG